MDKQEIIERLKAIEAEVSQSQDGNGYTAWVMIEQLISDLESE